MVDPARRLAGKLERLVNHVTEFMGNEALYTSVYLIVMNKARYRTRAGHRLSALLGWQIDLWERHAAGDNGRMLLEAYPQDCRAISLRRCPSQAPPVIPEAERSEAVRDLLQGQSRRQIPALRSRACGATAGPG